MSRRVCLSLKILTIIIFFASTASAADVCFNSSKKTNHDAETIRLKAMEMDWKVGNAAFLTAAGIIKGKVELYPNDNVEACLREEGGTLQIKT
jgi:hypothetical protein